MSTQVVYIRPRKLDSPAPSGAGGGRVEYYLARAAENWKSILATVVIYALTIEVLYLLITLP